MSLSQKPTPSERLAKLETEIRNARRHLDEESSKDWTSGMSGMLEGLSHDLDELSGDHHHRSDNELHGRFDELEARLGDIRSMIGAGGKG